MSRNILEATAQALFTYAEAYFVSASKLSNLKLDETIGHGDAPARMLWFHAIELYLKAFLIANGCTALELSKKPNGHNLKNLISKCQGYGLTINTNNQKHMEDAYNSDAIFQARYLEPNAPNKIIFDNGLLENIATHLREAIIKHPSRVGKIIVAGEGLAKPR